MSGQEQRHCIKGGKIQFSSHCTFASLALADASFSDHESVRPSRGSSHPHLFLDGSAAVHPGEAYEAHDQEWQVFAQVGQRSHAGLPISGAAKDLAARQSTLHFGQMASRVG